MAKGKFRASNGSSNKSQMPANGGFKGGELYSTEFEINETLPSARTLLTKGYVQDEINHFSGATVSTRGRFMTEAEKKRCPNERPLYLFVQGQNKLNIDLAMQKINEIIKTEHQNSLSRPSRFTNAPPPLMSLHSGVPSVEKICIGIDNAPPGFDLRGRIIGSGGANLLYIRGETGANVTLRGRGSQFIDPALGTESPEPLHLYIEHQKMEGLQNAKQLGINLIQTMQSELQSFIQQQPPPVQQQQILEAPPIQQIQQAHFQTMNIGALTQSNVVTIQHQDIIQHPQSSVVTLPATILTATMPGAPGAGVTAPPPGVHVPAHGGPMVPPSQNQELQTFMSPPPVGQVQLIGPPPTVSQVQYQIHSGQPLHIQMPPSSHSSPQPVAQMYVMSQPPPPPPPPTSGPPLLPSPQQNAGPPTFIASSSSGPAAGGGGAVSYVYAQPNMSQPTSSPSHTSIETVNVNLQQPPPPPPPPPLTQQPPPSLLHLHFPPPNFPPNHPPPPIPHTYQIQYQQMQPSGPPTQTQFVLQSAEHLVPQPIPHNPEHQLVPQQVVQSQFEGQPPPLSLQVPPPASQTFLIPAAQSPHHHPHQPQHHLSPQQPPLPSGAEVPPPGFECPMEQGLPPPPPPQPVPPPQMVPPPSLNQMPSSINILTSVPPPPPPQSQPIVQNAPWLYQAPPQPSGLSGSPHQQQHQQHQQQPHQHHPQQQQQSRPIQLQTQIHYHTQQLHYQNGHMQTQLHYTVQPPPGQQAAFELQKPDEPEQQKCQGLKRRFADVEGPQEAPPYQCGPPPPPPPQRQGNGEGAERQQRASHGPSPGGVGPTHGERNKPLLPPPHPGEKRCLDRRPGGPGTGNEGNFMVERGPAPQMPPAPWQAHHVRMHWGRPPPPPPPPPSSSSHREPEHHVLYPAPPPAPPPTNMPPPQIRPVRVFGRSIRRKS
ncbi:extensin-like isoform X2 [Venturia canescens]|uniref:extensin-like isoform X2 n=1 Tax=Venturia canescens TaxID=32260 RepID=UPI001C9CF0D4|nr:extensin-like isoform X2 [Venturia canescens]